MLYGMDVGVEKGLIVVGDSKGKMHFVDARSDEEIFHGQLHKKGMKVLQRLWAAFNSVRFDVVSVSAQ